ncbi:TetR/AcrR family transcriptional regulator [Xylanimonas cellulosilytica]|uniref:TetR/AcrR family transcriptional regulator n=1 Tax=Xylanimonas cellulosilytica TaxID=186189 RepID=UPI00019C097D|nr:TetR/AcrR family transcriptional regulator [Xylanimonas cellulosilytica]
MTDVPTISARRERTRERLLDAAAQVFARVGFGGASVEAIAEAAGFTRGAFYSNFESKEELFLALTTRQAQQHLAALESAVAGLDAAVVRGGHVDRGVIRTVLATVTEGKTPESCWFLMNAEFELLAMRDPEIGARWTRQQAWMRDELATALTRLLADVGLRFAVDPPLAVELLLAAHAAASRDAYVAGEQVMASPALEALVDLVITTAD